MKNSLLSLIAIFFLTAQIFAQQVPQAPKVRFEKVSEAEMTMKTYPIDTTAEAVILYDEGSSVVKYDMEKGFMLTHERFVRIKILKQSGVKWGNFNLSLYSGVHNKEELQQIKGTTFNFENGKAVKSEIKKDAIFHERENKYWESVRLSMPSVKVGSVIDLKYTIFTDLVWNLRTWKFQYTIPVKWSQYRVVYPEYFSYNHSSLGYHRLLYNKNSQLNETINFTEKIVSNSGGFNNGGETRETVYRNISYIGQIFEYAANDVPAMKGEPFLTTLDNFTTQVKFELSNVNFTKIGGTFKNYTTSWSDIARQLNEEENFGLQLKSSNFAEDAVTQLTKGTADTLEILNIIYNHVKNTIKWNGSNSVYTDKSLKKVYSDKTGNVADINLLLTVMLKKAGISAYPVVMSTRTNGLLPFTHASLSACNYVIVKAVIKGKPILLDATEPNLQVGCLPFRCMNGEGQLIASGTAEPVSLKNPTSIENTLVELQIKNGKMSGNIQKNLFGLDAFNFRESVKSAGGKQEYFDKIKNSSTDFDYLGYQYNQIDSLNQPVFIEYKIDSKEEQNTDAGIIYINPVMVGRQNSNPFSSPTREYPVDFGVPFSETYSLQLTIPEGYSLEELPKSKSLILPENAGKFQYQVTQLGNKVMLNFRISIDKTLFIPSDYESLKEFYNIVINKQAEQIVLKKTTI